MVTSPRHGHLDLALPGLRGYLREHAVVSLDPAGLRTPTDEPDAS